MKIKVRKLTMYPTRSIESEFTFTNGWISLHPTEKGILIYYDIPPFKFEWKFNGQGFDRVNLHGAVKKVVTKKSKQIEMLGTEKGGKGHFPILSIESVTDGVQPELGYDVRISIQGKSPHYIQVKDKFIDVPIRIVMIVDWSTLEAIYYKLDAEREERCVMEGAINGS